MTMLAVFRSRAQALDAISRLGGAGVPAQAVSTPKEAGYGCGLSVCYDARFQARVAVLMRQRAYSSFAGYLRSCGASFVRV